MGKEQLNRVCITPRLGGIGGPASFQRKLTDGLQARGIEVTYDLQDLPYQAILVISATRHLPALYQAKKRGIPIVQRLDGIWWHHRIRPRLPGYSLRIRLTHELRNVLVRFTRANLADYIVYQSEFVEKWWENAYPAIQKPRAQIYNGVDLKVFHPDGTRAARRGSAVIMAVEGTHGPDETSINIPIRTWTGLRETIDDAELWLFGNIFPAITSAIPRHPQLRVMGAIDNTQLPDYYRAADLFISSEINPPCPNSVVEALACGTPVIGFATGALPELVGEHAGKTTPYLANPWQLEQPSYDMLGSIAQTVMQNQQHYSQHARELAEAKYSLDAMVDKYLDVFQTAL